MKIRHKSLWRSKNLTRHFRIRANQRAAKEQKRLERVAREEEYPDTSTTHIPKRNSSGFRITVECLEDGEKVSFSTLRLPIKDFPLSISPTLAGKKVTMILANYVPIRKELTTRLVSAS